MEHRICRLCESSDSVARMVKYAVRSYVHWGCRLKRSSLEDGLAWLRSMPSHVIQGAPVLKIQGWLDDRGWKGERALELLLQAAKSASTRESR